MLRKKTDMWKQPRSMSRSWRNRAKEEAESGGKNQTTTRVLLSGTIPVQMGRSAHGRPSCRRLTSTPICNSSLSFVPTMDTVRFSFLMHANYEGRSPIFFTGITGTGKSAIMSAIATRTLQDRGGGRHRRKRARLGLTTLPVPINFSGQTQSALVQSTIEAN